MGKIIIGSFLILMGLGIFLDQTSLRLIGINSGTIWSLFWVVIGIVLLQKRKVFIGLIFVLCGVLGFLGGFLHIDFGAWIFPIIVIALGIRILIKDDSKGGKGDVIGTISKSSSTEEYINETAIFAGLEKKYISQNFKGGKLDCVFSGMKIDLRDIKVSKDGAKLEVNAIFGGGEIWVGKNTRVIAQGTGIFGGWNNNFTTEGGSNLSVLKLTGSAVFGGVEIKN